MATIQEQIQEAFDQSRECLIEATRLAARNDGTMQANVLRSLSHQWLSQARQLESRRGEDDPDEDDL